MTKGRKQSEKTKNKISNSLKGKHPSEKTLQKLRISHLGNKHSEESKKKISNALKGKKHPNFGKFMSEEQKKKISSSSKGKKLSDITKKKISKALKGKNTNGYTKYNIPLYNNYYKKLTIEEDAKRGESDRNILTVVCTSCKKRFIPKLTAVQERVRCLNNDGGAESRLYCSDNCKSECSIYRKINSTKISTSININFTSSEYQTFRTYVLERDDYKCQYCGEKAEHVHHERPQKLEPFFALDPDLAWSVCKKCHYKYGHKDECSTGKLSHIICNKGENI